MTAACCGLCLGNWLAPARRRPNLLSFTPCPLSLSSTASKPNPVPVTDPAPDCWFADEIQPHEPALRAFLHRKFPTLTEVDDVVQESFLRAFLARQKGTLTAARGFLFTVAGNLTISLFRRRKFLSGTPVSELSGLSVVKDEADVHESVCTQEELSLIAEAIAGLPERCRQVAVRRLLRRQEFAEISTELGISEQTVRVQVARAMKKCRQYFRDRGITGRVRA